MKRHGNIWAINPAHLDIIRAERLELAASGLAVEAEKIDLKAAQSAKLSGSSGGSVAVLNILGPMEQYPTFEGWLFGYVSMEIAGQVLRALDHRSDVSAIVMRINSPGGTVAGTPELAAIVKDIASRRKVIAQVSSMAASAAYWVASQASEIVVSPSGQVGSIGVIAEHQDISGYLDKIGVKPTLITSSEFKAEGNPYEPLDEEALKEIQGTVDAYHRQFVADVAKGRGVSIKKVESEFGQGRMIMAREAVELGMADRIGTFEETFARVSKRSGGASAEAEKPGIKAETVPVEQASDTQETVTETVEKPEPKAVEAVPVSMFANRLKLLRLA